MNKLNFPSFQFKIKKDNNNNIIFDEIRKKWFILTPEEWVRQNFIKFLLYKNYPESLINCEKSFYINNVLKRYDIVVFNNNGGINVLVECKSPKIKIIKEHFDQVMRYNIKLNSEIIVVTNGLTHFYFNLNKKTKKYQQEKDLVFYNK